jgi:DNA-binding CsgD family transcriptional regulator
MDGPRWPVERLVDEIAVLGSRGLPRDEYYREVGNRLRRVFDADAMCWHTLDPASRLMTSDAPYELLEEGVFTAQTAPAAGALIVASEYLREDVNAFAALAGRRVPVGILSEATRGRPERSARYREVLAPSDIPFELRAAFVSRGRCWGAVHIARRGDKRDFDRGDAAALARVTSAIADGIRTALCLEAARRPDDPAAPGLAILGPANEVELITAPARELFAALRSPAVAERDETPPTSVLALASYARNRGRVGGHQPDVVALPSASGWVTLHASLPEGPGGGRVAIVVESSATQHSTALRLEARGVTPREREVAALLARGCSNAEIATQLVLSPYTIQDHVKSLFEKTGVASRQELVARIFLDDYLPHVVRRTPLDSTGSFVRAPATSG